MRGFISQQWARLTRSPEGISLWAAIALIFRPVLLGVGTWVLWYLETGRYDAVMVSGISLVVLAVALAGFAETRGLPRSATVTLRSAAAVLLVLAPAMILVWAAVTVGVFTVPMIIVAVCSILALSWIEIPLGYNRGRDSDRKSNPSAEDFSRPQPSQDSEHSRPDRVHGRKR